MPASFISASAASSCSTSPTVRTVFRCVASRNRERVFYWGSLRLISNRACGQKSGSASLASHTPSGPNPLGENQSLSSTPLEPRGLLLSVMRQKVGKERSQGVFAPLANPRNGPSLAEKNPVFVCRAAPAPGYRHAGSGTLYHVGSNGFSWSSTASGSYAHFLDFYYYGVYPQNSYGRALGLLLRCLQE